MPIAATSEQAEQNLSEPGVDRLVRDLGIPPQPCIQVDPFTEMRRPKPDTQRIARIMASDVALTAAVLRGVDVDVAQTCGLFCDVGIPLLMQRFQGYGATLQAANAEPQRSFTEVEQDSHHTDHALVGALMLNERDVDG